MFLFKKVDATVLDVMIAYGCGAFLMYAIGSVAYGFGKVKGMREAEQGKREQEEAF